MVTQAVKYATYVLPFVVGWLLLVTGVIHSCDHCRVHILLTPIYAVALLGVSLPQSESHERSRERIDVVLGVFARFGRLRRRHLQRLLAGGR